MNPVETYRQMCPTLAPRDDGRCHCGLVVWSRDPCTVCGGYTRERLEEVLREGRDGRKPVAK